MVKKKKIDSSTVARNRKARFNYEILEELEAGIVLTGSEVKSLRSGKADITEAHADVRGAEMFLLNCYIPEYGKAGRFNHEPRRPRKLLLHKKEIKKLTGKVLTKGLTLVALTIYFNRKGLAKVKLALAKGKAKHDKRETIKNRDWEREKARTIREG